MDEKLFQFTDLDYTPEKPGIYAWYCYPDSKINLQEYFKLYKSKTLKTKSHGNLGELFVGNLKSIINIDQSKQQLSDTLLTTFKAFSPPLYIGISKNLRTRLQSHADQLNNIIYNENYTIDDDDDNYFANRIGPIVKSNSSISLKYLNVKIVTLPDVTRKEIQDSEYILNRTFNPIFGLR